MQNTLPEFSLLILSYNNRANLDACFSSIFKSRGAPTFEVVLLDNGGDDGAARWTRENWPAVRVFESPTNLGVAGGKAELARHALGNLLYFLDNDATSAPDSLAEIHAHLRDNPAVGVVGPRTFYPDGSVASGLFALPTVTGYLQRVLALGRPIGRTRWVGFRRMRVYRYEEVLDAGFAPGSALVIRREALDAAGGWDPAFFCYFDETDLCRRVRECGWRVHLVPLGDVVHHVGSVSGRSTRFGRSWAAICSVLFFRKAYGFPRSTAYVFLRVLVELAVDVRAVLRLLFRSRRARALEVLGSSADFYRFLLDARAPYRALEKRGAPGGRESTE